LKHDATINTADNIVALTVVYSFRVLDDIGIWLEDILCFFGGRGGVGGG